MRQRDLYYFVLACAAIVPYLPFLSLPVISDTYTQIFLARHFGSPTGWADLAADPLYRCRATSLVFTYVVDALFGAGSIAHMLSGFAVHMVNVWLLFALGRWRIIGHRIAFPAALFFALYEGHQEAVVWVAALPELLMFFFSLVTLHAWIRWSERGFAGWRSPAVAAAAFILALLSKESAVAIVPVLAWVAWRAPARWNSLAAGMLALFAALSAAYAALIFSASRDHLHLNDGTFSFAAPFWLILPHTVSRMLWFWGVLGLAVVTLFGLWRRRALEFSAVWIVCTLLPYSFLLYMSRVPSRHTYFAAAGLALFIGSAVAMLRDRWRTRWLLPAFAILVAVHNCGYLWAKKLPQYERRAQATEHFLDFARQHAGVIEVSCRGPYPMDVYRHAAAVVLNRPVDSVLERSGPALPDTFCEELHP